MLFLDPDPKVPLSMLPHISSLLWMTTTAKVRRRIDVVRYQNRNKTPGLGGNHSMALNFRNLELNVALKRI